MFCHCSNFLPDVRLEMRLLGELCEIVNVTIKQFVKLLHQAVQGAVLAVLLLDDSFDTVRSRQAVRTNIGGENFQEKIWTQRLQERFTEARVDQGLQLRVD